MLYRELAMKTILPLAVAIALLCAIGCASEKDELNATDIPVLKAATPEAEVPRSERTTLRLIDEMVQCLEEVPVLFDLLNASYLATAAANGYPDAEPFAHPEEARPGLMQAYEEDPAEIRQGVLESLQQCDAHRTP